MNNVRIKPSAAVLIPALAVLLLFTVDAHAAVSNTDMLNGIVEKMQTATQGMADKLVDFATTLFWSLAVINMVWTFGMMVMRKADIGEFFAELVRFTIFTGFFWWLLSNAVSGMNIGGTIIESMRNMAAQATGLGRELSPSGIVDIGFNVLFTVYNADLGFADKLLAYAVAVIILLIFAAVAVNMVLVLAESWFLLYGGIFVLGFGGSRWTSDIAIGYYRQVLGVGFKLFGMAVIIGVGKGFIDGFLADLSQKPGILELAVILVAAYVFFKLSDRIPSMLASLIPGGGGPGGFAGGSGAVSAGAIAGAAAGVAGAAMTGGASLAATAAGGAQAVMAAASKASDNVSAGTDILSSMMGGSSDSPDAGSGGDAGGGGGGSGGGETPMASAAGDNSSGARGGSSGGGSGGGRSSGGIGATAAKGGRIATDTVANLAKGIGSMASAKAGSMADAAKSRIAETTGGKLAATIKAASSNENAGTGPDAAPAFDGNNLAGTKDNTAAGVDDEVAVFVNRPQPT
ncbi:P-type conjugative transfer protein TrbL [Pseudomonas aeruginosa]|uniref:P-type conjugative transfer protein TrbL n=1 Tax=Pseudomonas aeruginosa TaxID=287 RepID=UPI001048B202|nr:P-type conjugative transfer protein TrbL [Pseudomonas aeruginosa]QBL15890.1 P-type conjugative transfer protein TrbL [Pseudomonas aeruginosa]